VAPLPTSNRQSEAFRRDVGQGIGVGQIRSGDDWRRLEMAGGYSADFVSQSALFIPLKMLMFQKVVKNAS